MCGIVGAVFERTPQDMGQTLYTMLYHLQHRGQDSAGMTVERAVGLYQTHRDLGTIDRVFTRVDLTAPEYHGYSGIAHTRYSTSGVDFNDPRQVREAQRAAQPMEGNFRGERFFCAYNGNLTPAYFSELYREIYSRGYHSDLLQRDSWVDTELLVKRIEVSDEPMLEDALLRDVCPHLRGAFSLLVLFRGMVYAVRDTHGFRPLEIGRNSNGLLAASEDAAFNKFPGGIKVRSVNPGECVVLRRGRIGLEMRSFSWGSAPTTHLCQFEGVYFSRFDSTFGGEEVGAYQERLGRALAREHPPPKGIDMVVGVPDSGIGAAYGYALESGIRYEPRALIRLHGVGRTFIEPANDLRRRGVEFKFSTIPKFAAGKKIIIVDDSLVRGTVAPHIVYLLKEIGAQEVHIRISCPPQRYGCWYGIDTYRIEKELIARGTTEEDEIRRKINQIIVNEYMRTHILDSLHYLSLQGMESVWGGEQGLCNACWTGNYPVI